VAKVFYSFYIKTNPMKIVRLFLPVFFLFILINSSYAQYFNDGQDNGSIRWKHIQTLHFEVIFPEGFEQQGEHVAKLLEKAYGIVSYSLNHQPKKISVVLHSGTVKSNAFLGWCPGRIEMYTTPNQGTYSQDWLEQLSIHEFRHMVQVSKLESEMPQLLRYLFGEHAAALLTGIYLPFWFIEGDAVAAETGLSESGRGRLPEFNRELRAQLVEKGKYSYEKAYLGSFRNHIPNHYQMGYLVVAGAREKNNKLVWDSVLSNVAKHPLSLTAFNKGIKKSTHLSASALYNTIFDDLTNKWKEEDHRIPKTQYVVLSLEKRYYTSYSNGIRLSTGDYFALRSGLSDIDRFVTLSPEGKEKVLFTPGYQFEESVTASKNLIVWSERLYDLRWNHDDKSLLRIFDVNTGKIKELRFDSKLFAPAVSPDMNKVVAVEADHLYQFYLTEVELLTGKVTGKYKSRGNDYFLNPSYSDDSRSIFTILMHNNQKGIVRINLKDSTEKLVLPLRNQEIKRPLFHKGYVWFIGGYRGIDDLYALDTIAGKTYRVITSRFGISDYSFDNNSVIYSDYSADGYKMVKTNLDSVSFQEINPDTIKNQLPFAVNLARQEKQPIDFTDLDDVSYQSTPYAKAAHLFHFHSWAPLSIDPYNYQFYPGISFMSQNMLSTAETVLGYRYKWEENKGEYYVDFSYMGW
jgi:hypothetical protein